jgi:hypothetical protein
VCYLLPELCRLPLLATASAGMGEIAAGLRLVRGRSRGWGSSPGRIRAMNSRAKRASTQNPARNGGDPEAATGLTFLIATAGIEEQNESCVKAEPESCS